MSESDLRAAIEGPARQVGPVAGARSGRPARYARSRASRARCRCCRTPSHQTWQRREGRTLTVDGLPAHRWDQRRGRPVGRSGLRPGPRRPAATAARPPAAAGHAHARGEPVRSRVPRRTVATDPEHEQLIELLVRARLVTSDDDTVELAHESLARAWPRLRSWLDDDVEGQRILRHLTGRRRHLGRAWVGPTASCTAASASPKRSTGRTVPIPTSPQPSEPSSTPAPNANEPKPRRPNSGCATRPARTGACAPCSPEPPCSSSSPCRRPARRAAGQPGRPRHDRRRCPPGRRPGPGRGRHRPIAAARGRGGAPRRHDRHPSQPARRPRPQSRTHRLDSG